MQHETRLLKDAVRKYWDKQACGSSDPAAHSIAKYTREYFECIEEERYRREPEIFSFAQFTRFSGKKILEVGIGAATDFLQWIRAGAEAYGIDLTEEGVEHAKRRLALYGLEAAEIKVGDAEAIPYPDNTFDLVYSWGVIHHTPNTEQALREIVRVCRPGGICKIMIYNRHSLVSYFLWMRRALLTGKPWKSLSWCLAHYMESPGTKAFTRKEVDWMLSALPVDQVRVRPVFTYYDRLEGTNLLFTTIARMLGWILGGDRVGWFLTIEFKKRK